MPAARRRALVTVACLAVLWPAAAGAFEITPPNPVIKIPGLSDFTVPTPSPPDDKTLCPEIETIGATGCLFIPWIGQYVARLYEFGVLASTILATVVLMVAGYLWLTAGGNVTQIGTARSYLGGALVGVSLMLGSYAILKLVNPRLVRFEALRIPVVKKISIEEFAEDLFRSGALVGDCLLTGTNTPLTALTGTDLSPDLQAAFNEAGQTYQLSPAFVASITAWETRGCFGSTSGACANRATVSPKGAAGISQILPGTAADIWDRYSAGVVTRPAECDGDDNPRGKTRYTDTCARWMESHPREVILMSAAYLKRYVQPQLARCGFGHNIGIIAAGYNAGPGAPGLCDGIPNGRENREYVVGAKGFYTKYCAQSGGQAKPLAEHEVQQPEIQQVFPGMFSQ